MDTKIDNRISVLLHSLSLFVPSWAQWLYSDCTMRPGCRFSSIFAVGLTRTEIGRAAECCAKDAWSCADGDRFTAPLRGADKHRSGCPVFEPARVMNIPIRSPASGPAARCEGRTFGSIKRFFPA